MASKVSKFVSFLLFFFTLVVTLHLVEPRTFVPGLTARTTEKVDCDSCVVDVRSILTNLKLTRNQDVPRLNETCRKLENMEGQCDQYISLINSIYGILEKNIDPKAACTYYGLCSSSSSRLVADRKGKALFSGERENSISSSRGKQTGKKEEELKFGMCSQCQTITRYIEEQVADYKTEEEIAKFIQDDVCGRLPNKVLAETCQSFMREYGDSFIYKIALKVFDPNTVCTQEFHVCPKSILKTPADKSSDIEILTDSVGSTCNLCVDMVSQMESTISEGNLNDSEVMKSPCNQFDSKETIEKCKVMLDAFGPHFVQMIGFNSPKKICSTVDICYNGTNTHLLGGKKCTFGPSYWCHTLDHANACKAANFCKKNVWKPVEQKIETTDVQSTPQCVLCHLLLHIVDRELEKNSTVKEIESILDSACKKIYKDESKRNECQDRVEKYTKRFIDLATQGVAPEVACIIFGFCEVGEDVQSLTCLGDEKITCPICKSVVEKVYETVSDNKTREEIDEALKNACNHLPEAQKKACLVYVKVYDETLAQLIADTADSGEVCRKIGLCPEEKDEISIEMEPEKPVDPECMLCKRVFEYIYAYLQENRTQSAIEEALGKVCDEVFPSSRKKSCRKFIDTYTAQIIDIVLQTTDPKEACVLLGICKQSTNGYTVEGQEEVEEIVDVVPLTMLVPSETPKYVGSSEDCDRCNLTVSFIAREFKSSSQTLYAELENSCLSYLKDSAKCKSHMVSEFWPATQALAFYTSTNFLCTNLFGLCPANQTERNSSTVNSMEKRSDNEVEVEGKATSPKSSEFDFIDSKLEETCKSCLDLVQKMESDQEIESICSQYEVSVQKQKCRSIHEAFGKHISSMISFNSAEKICSSLDLCYQAANNHLLGGQKCSFGPTYWCNTKAHAEACNAVDFCRRKIWIPIE